MTHSPIHPRAMALAACAAAAFAVAMQLAPPASASAGNLKVTFVARVCPSYSAVTANLARNNLQESLENLGPDTVYSPGQPIDPSIEAVNQPLCTPLVGWPFTLGTGIQQGGSVGPWGALSIVTNPYDHGKAIVTEDEVPLFNASGGSTSHKIKGAVNYELNDHLSDLAARPASLWTQGGTPSDPVQNTPHPGEYGFAALRCAIDNLNGDNVEWISAPLGAKVVFCFAYYVKTPPPSGKIVVRKTVSAPAGTAAKSFRFTGNISYEPDQSFEIAAAPGADGQQTFQRAAVASGGTPWSFREEVPPGWTLSGLSCTSQNATSTVTTDLAAGSAAVELAAGDTVTCSYTDTLVPPPAGLQITKTTLGGTGTFGFAVTPASGGSAASASATTTAEGVETAAVPSLSLPAGDYAIAETLPASRRGAWKTTSVSCNGQPMSNFDPVRLTLLSGQGTVCDYTNTFTPNGSIRLQKVTLGAVGTTGFVVTPVSDPSTEFRKTATTTTEGDAVTASGDDTSAIDLGEYDIQETTPTDKQSGTWQLNGVECDGEPVPSEQGRIRVKLTASHPDVDCKFVDQFNAGDSGGDIGSEVAEPQTNLKVTKRVDRKHVRIGQLLTYTITVKNRSRVTATNVTVAETRQSGASIVRFPSGRECRRSPFPTCQIGTLKPGAKVTLRVLVRPRRSGLFVNRVAVNTAIQETSLRDNAAEAAVRVLARPRFTG